VRIGLALGGGFARGIAHAGVLEIFEQNGIPIHCIAGVSAGSIVAAASASGATAFEIGRAGCAMRFGDVARWSLSRMGFVVSERMNRFLRGLLKRYIFEDMRMPLGVVATDLATGSTVLFRGPGDVFVPIRASCSYPGLFQPVRHDGRLLVDGAMTMEVPTRLCRELGATHVLAVHLPAQWDAFEPGNMFQVVNRCFQIMQSQTEANWRMHANLVITPDVRGIQWDGFSSGATLIEAGIAAARKALPVIQGWLPTLRAPAPSESQAKPNSVPA
jgi:NTE family protein